MKFEIKEFRNKELSEGLVVGGWRLAVGGVRVVEDIPCVSI